MPRKAVLLLTTLLLAGTALTACSPDASEPGQSAPATTPLVTTGADAEPTGVPTTTPPAAATAEAREAPPAWDACVAAVRQQQPDLPSLDDVWAYEETDVRDAPGGAVADVRFGHGDDGRVEAEFACQVSGTPEAPVVDLVTRVEG